MSTISVPFTTKNAPITAASTTASFTSASLPHGLQITDDDKGPAVNLAVWISLVTMCIVVIAKVFSKLLKAQDGIQAKNLQSDDFLVLAASVRLLDAKRPMLTGFRYLLLEKPLLSHDKYRGE